MPRNAQMLEVAAPAVNATALKRPSFKALVDSFKRKSMPTAKMATKMPTKRYSRDKNAMAPSPMAPEMSLNRALTSGVVPALSMDTARTRREYTNAAM